MTILKKYDLENRLINFTVSVMKMTEKLPRTFAGNHLANQITRSATSPALHYGEAQSAESRSDFIHKMQIALKELRETHCSLKIISRLEWLEQSDLSANLNECNKLISIFVKSIATAQINRQTEKLK